MEEALEKCNICDSEVDQDNGNIVGEFGVRSVSFCARCYSSMTEMVIKLEGLNNIPALQGKIKNLKEEEKDKAYYNALKKMYKNTQERIRQAKKEKDDTSK